MKVSMWSSYYIDLSPEEMVNQFADQEWFLLELSDEHGLSLLNRGNPEMIGHTFKTYAKDKGVSFPQGHLWLTCDIIGQEEGTIDRLKRWLDLYYAIGVKAAVLHPGGQERLKNGDSYEALLDLRTAALESLTAHIKGTDLAICLENIRHTAPEVEDLLEIITAVGSDNLGICLDTGHLHMGSGAQAKFIIQAGSHLRALHIADNDGSSDQHLMPFGRGTIAWHDVVTALKSVEYQGLFNLEIPGETRCPVEVRKMKLDYLQSMINWLITR